MHHIVHHIIHTFIHFLFAFPGVAFSGNRRSAQTSISTPTDYNHSSWKNPYIPKATGRYNLSIRSRDSLEVSIQWTCLIQFYQEPTSWHSCKVPNPGSSYFGRTVTLFTQVVWLSQIVRLLTLSRKEAEQLCGGTSFLPPVLMTLFF